MLSSTSRITRVMPILVSLRTLARSSRCLTMAMKMSGLPFHTKIWSYWRRNSWRRLSITPHLHVVVEQEVDGHLGVGLAQLPGQVHVAGLAQGGS